MSAAPILSSGGFAVYQRGLAHGSARPANLSVVANHSRFPILPWVRIPRLASHILARAARQVPADWLAHFGVETVLLETLVGYIGSQTTRHCRGQLQRPITCFVNRIRSGTGPSLRRASEKASPRSSPSALDLFALLRKEITEQPEKVVHLGLNSTDRRHNAAVAT